MTNLDSMLKSRDITLWTKVHTVKLWFFPVVMYGCESWITKKSEHWRTDAFVLWCWRRFLQVPLDSKEIKPVNPKGNQPWIFIGRAEAEIPILWPLDVKSWFIGKDPDAGKDWGQEEKGQQMVGSHYQLNGHEFEQTPGDSRGWGSLACCSPWGCTEADMTERLNNTTESWTQCHLCCPTQESWMPRKHQGTVQQRHREVSLMLRYLSLNPQCLVHWLVSSKRSKLLVKWALKTLSRKAPWPLRHCSSAVGSVPCHTIKPRMSDTQMASCREHIWGIQPWGSQPSGTKQLAKLTLFLSGEL